MVIGFFGAAVAPKQQEQVRRDKDGQRTQTASAPVKPKSANPPESRDPSIGDRVVITEEMLMGINEAALKEARKLLRANDEIGLTQMEAQGQMFIVQKGTEGLLLEGGIFTMRVRVLTGPHAGKAGYIATDFVKKK